MRAIMIMYDSLRRDMLPGYRDPDKAPNLNLPNFERLAERTAIFNNSYVGSLPCMPARREIHTGRYNFLHRSWGPIEPFDDSMPEILDKNGIHTHLATDHYHYIEDGGATYHGRYSTWACYRGQESDTWKGSLEPQDEISPYTMGWESIKGGFRKVRSRGSRQNYTNRNWMQKEEDYPQTLTVDDGVDFMRRNAQYDNWFLQIETFDPHEPFDSPDSFISRWFDLDKPFVPDWPPYDVVTEDDETVNNMRKKYFALMEFCDKNLGRILDEMDNSDMWKDTMLIVNTDHGFFLSEHGWWGKGLAPDFNTLCNTPLYIWDPRHNTQGSHRNALVQTIDLAPTILDFFSIEIPKDMLGVPLGETVANDVPVREYSLFGYHGCPVSITDGRYVYMRAVADPDAPLYDYTLMPTHMKKLFSPAEMQNATLSEPFSFTKGCPVLKIPALPSPRSVSKQAPGQDLMFDLLEDPLQEHPIENEEKKAELLAAMTELFRVNDAPAELYARYGLEPENDGIVGVFI